MKKQLLMSIIALLTSQAGIAQVQEAELSQSPLPGPVIEAPGIIELPTMQVWGEKQELALRMVKSAFDRGRLTGYDARNKLYCWFDTGVGSHMIYLYCTLNRVLNDVNLAFTTGGGFVSSINAAANVQYKKTFISDFPVNPLQFRQKLQALGPTELNEEIVLRARQGEPMPDNVPTKAEIDRFANALTQIKALRAQSDVSAGMTTAELDRRLGAIIDANGLTIERYNHISLLVDRYSSLRKMVSSSENR